MERYYYNNETQEIVSIDIIRSDYFGPFGEDSDTLEEHVTAFEEVKRELNRKLELAREYGYDEYGDEIIDLMQQMNELRGRA